ncbi:LOW QUALITY PROTEIN: beta-D-glucosyl crocetin beta-1,6-glucosyltransferase-like [Syzygium oleosum]|uniref:LOW QUALITY PROTEIN: beta-D-glucosyl crocetin beta-1,6-glucosyltransferase-like n=1 Tax=Syzygium oleosum TaxID=219896 RepID=UPI0011D20200|nr:LOW QUALITY PROTEIN: beta-D-glucosyl crocetin beta-1,6-glucosyltransferase-like [Syzygium oleosum]
MDNMQRPIKVMMLPWLAHGHISPFLELAKRLSTRNFHIYLCSTPVNLSFIKPKISEKYSSSIELVELHLPSPPELPPHYHTTKGLPPHLMNTLKVAFDMASPVFSDIVKSLGPNLLIHDFLQPWAAEAVKSHGMPSVVFFSIGAGTLSFIFHMVKNAGSKFPFEAIRLHDYEQAKLIKVMDDSAVRVKDKDRVLQSVERSSNFILLKTFRELDGKYMDYLSSLLGKNVVPVGPLVEDPSNIEDGDFEWLDKREKSSTNFVSFGSEYFPTEKEREEIAYGLELSNVNFIWVIRFTVGESTELEEALPEGFFERVRDRGLVIDGWAPQGKILEHPSIGGFVSHCGWSSIIESMNSGVPIIAMPMQLDQPLNARTVEEIGVGLQVKRNKSGELERLEIAKVIKDVVVEKDGESVRKKAKEMSYSIRNKGEGELDEVADALVQLCVGNKEQYVSK